MLSKEEIETCKEELLKRISKEKYGDEWYIEIAILSYERQQEKTYTFFRDDKQEDLLRKYSFCQRPDSTNMSLRRFTKNGEIEGYMSESLAEEFGLVQVDLNEFIHKFVKVIIKENLQLEANKPEWQELCEECSAAAKKIGLTKADTDRIIKESRETIEKANKYDSLIKKMKDKVREVGTTIDKQVSSDISITAEEFYSNNAIYNFGKELLKEVEE